MNFKEAELQQALPKLVWKEMTLEEVKAVQVGDKIRINGCETTVTDIYDRRYDFGFDFFPKVKCHHSTTMGDDSVCSMIYKFEHLVEETEMNNRLIRDKEYDVKLTGEEIAWLHFATARACDTYGLYDKIRSEYRSLKLTTDLEGEPQSRTLGVGWDADYRKDVYEWLTKVFTIPETEDQRKLRELKEQYESLGKAIEALEKK